MACSADLDRILAFSCVGCADQVDEQRLTGVIGPRLLKLRDEAMAATHGVF